MTRLQQYTEGAGAQHAVERQLETALLHHASAPAATRQCLLPDFMQYPIPNFQHSARLTKPARQKVGKRSRYPASTLLAHQPLASPAQ